MVRELQDVLEKSLKDIPRVFLVKRIKEKLAKAGAKLARGSIQKIADHILSGSEEPFVIEGSEEAKDQLTITPEDLEWVVASTERFPEEDIAEVVEKAANQGAESVYAVLDHGWPKEWAQQIADIEGFKERLELRWGKALGKLRMLLTVAREWGQEFYTAKLQEGSGSLSELDDVLLRLHVRGCQVAMEVIALLESGLADGAMARWRTLHEIAVVAAVIAKHGAEIAERYVNYQIVEAKRALSAYEACHKDLGYKPYSKKKAVKVRSDYARIVRKYGKTFGTDYGDYGWAAHHLGKESVTFAMLEGVAGDKVMRAHYRMASYNVHASPKGIYFKLGQLMGSNVLLVGASNAGLFDPAQNTSLTLGKLTLNVFLGATPSLDDLVKGKIIERLIVEIPLEFEKADKKLRRDERRHRSRW